jgi:hypothetical protein
MGVFLCSMIKQAIASGNGATPQLVCGGGYGGIPLQTFRDKVLFK